jgi:hypothetical protein
MMKRIAGMVHKVGLIDRGYPGEISARLVIRPAFA